MTNQSSAQSFSQPLKPTLNSKASPLPAGKSGSDQTKGAKAAGQFDDSALPASVIPLIAEIGADAKNLAKLAAEVQSQALGDLAAEITGNVAKIWAALLGQKISGLAIPREAVPEILAILERYAAPIS